MWSQYRPLSTGVLYVGNVDGVHDCGRCSSVEPLDEGIRYIVDGYRLLRKVDCMSLYEISNEQH